MTMIVVVATIKAEAAHASIVDAALKKAEAAVQHEPGCLQYELHRDIAEPYTFVMLERWQDAAALDAHEKGAALAELAAELKGKASSHVAKLTRAS